MSADVASTEEKPAKPQQFKRYRWLMSYADMITLLMAMFVLMLSLSSTDAKKFDIQADTMRKIFNNASGGWLPTGVQDKPSAATDIEIIDEDVKKAAEEREWRNNVSQAINEALASEVKSGASQVLQTDHEVIIRFPDASAFDSGSSSLRDVILPTLDRVVSIFQKIEGQIVVSGHTDNVPISTAAFRSNWELSVARAVSVIHSLLKDGRIKASRVTAQGFADSRPLAANDKSEGRAQNRRVDIAITPPENLSGALKSMTGGEQSEQ